MGSESILDLDEARRRLQQMDREQADVLQLVAKLRDVHRTLESQARLLEDRAESAEERLTRLRVLVRALRNRGLRLQSAADQAVADLDKERQRVAHACDSLRSALEQHQAQWCSEQRAFLETAALQQANEMATMAHTWEKELADLRDELATMRDQTHRRLESMSCDWKRELAAVNASVESRLQTQLSDTNREVGQDLVSVRHEVRSLVNRRTYVAAAAIGVSLFLAAYGLMGRTSPSAADDNRVERGTRTDPIAGVQPNQSTTSAGNEPQAGRLSNAGAWA